MKEQVSHKFGASLSLLLHLLLCFLNEVISLPERSWSLLLITVSDIDGLFIVVKRVPIELKEFDE